VPHPQSGQNLWIPMHSISGPSQVPYGLNRPLMPHDENGVELTVRFGVPYDELERRAGPDLSQG